MSYPDPYSLHPNPNDPNNPTGARSPSPLDQHYIHNPAPPPQAYGSPYPNNQPQAHGGGQYGDLAGAGMGGRDDGYDEDGEEKKPLTGGLGYGNGMGSIPEDGRSGVHYPPGATPFLNYDPYSTQSPYPAHPQHSNCFSSTHSGPGRPQSQASGDTGFIHRQNTAKRGATRRKFKLTGEGHFIREYPVPRPVENAVEPRWRDKSQTSEFTHVRYSAVTCDPDDFTQANGWNLRQKEYGRDTELLIAVTSYNEDKILYARTLHALMLNIRDICNNKSSKFWRRQAEEGRPPWQKITVALIADGLGPMDKGTLDLLATVGIYQDAVIKKDVDGKKTVAHMFEYTTQISVDAKPSLVQPHPGDPNNLVPVQLIFCLKAENEKKINSHRWLFNAIGRMLQPEICVLIDAGTRPRQKSIYYLWEAFYNDPNLGGACGEITAMIKGGKKLINPLVAAQNFEYKMSNILDKPLETTFGYVSVLPGAFSAYRFKAIQGRPLEQYFHGDHSLAERLGPKGVNGMNIFQKNMFLAEDRILCFELAAKAGDRWTLGYVKPSKAETDVPETAAELISQRRRWLNGSFAASIYALVHFFDIYKSRHGPIRMFMLHLQAIYNVLSLFMSFFGLANIFITFAVIIQLLPAATGINIFATPEITFWVNLACVWVFLTFVGLQVVLGLGNRPKGERFLYLTSFAVFGVLSLYTLVCAVILSVRAIQNLFQGSFIDGFKDMFTTTNGLLVIAGLSIFIFYFVSSMLFRDPWHLFSSFPQYMIIAPSFILILMIYSFCNLHDVSWGTKGSDKIESALPSVKVDKKEGGTVEVEDIQRDQDELDDAFKLTVQRTVAPVPKGEVREIPTKDDENKTFRTRTLGVWLLLNTALAIAITTSNGLDDTANRVKACFPGDDFFNNSTGVNATCVSQAVQSEAVEQGDKTKAYFSALLYITAGLTGVKFLGCVMFWVRRQTTRWFRKS